MEDSAEGTCEFFSSQSLHHVTLPIDEVSTKEQLKLCCKPRFKIRRVKRKGAVLVLVWNFLALFVLWYLNNSQYRSYIPNSDNGTLVSLALFGLTLPLAGWLADACVGRYKMIYCSVLIMWAATILETLSTVVEKLNDNYTPINAVVTPALLGLMGIGLGGFLSIVVQFGIDQLYDAPTDEISAFIIWHVWAFGGPIFIMNLTFTYLSFSDQHFILLGNLTLCVNLSLILVMLFCCNNWLIKEPILQNPFILIYRVSKYALKNKHPQCRSAFTYCEDEAIGRIDFGKSKYGGPFTTEQVEDVKTFYRVLPMIILGGIFIGELLSGNFLNDYLKLQFVVPHHSPSELKGFTSDSISVIIPFSLPVLIVLHEILFHPLFHRCFPWITSLHKIIMGAILQIGTFLSLMIFELISRQSYLKKNGYNATVSCVFYKDQNLATKFNYNWIAVPDILFAISVLLMAIGGLNFIAAQVPYSLKGVLLGVGYCSVSITVVINYMAITIGPFQQKLSVWGTGVISCGFWYALLHIVLCTFGFIAGALIIKFYKKRKREDVLPNEYFYAERYYSDLLQ